MPTFPPVIVAPPNYALWLWLVIPLVLAGVFFVVEHIVERVTDKRLGRPIVGVGYVGMGVCLIVAAVSIPIIPDIIYAQRNAAAVSALSDLGFSEIRMNIDNRTFGAYYEGDLMRGVLVESGTNPGVFEVVWTDPPLT